MYKQFVEGAKKTINECFYFNIASITKEGLPWNTPVYFSFDKNYTFYWGSARDSVHSQNIRRNPNVFITIYPYAEKGVGVYVEAEAYEISDDSEVLKALKIMDRKGGKIPRNSEDFLKKSPLRMYKAIPKKVYVSAPETADKYNKLWVDKRVEITLA